MKKKDQTPELRSDEELISLNENIYDLFSAEELELRLQTSAALVYDCGTDCGVFNCSTNCPTVFSGGGGGGGGGTGW